MCRFLYIQTANYPDIIFGLYPVNHIVCPLCVCHGQLGVVDVLLLVQTEPENGDLEISNSSDSYFMWRG